MRPQVITINAATNDSVAICASQTVTAPDFILNGNLVTGGVATAANAQRVTLDSAGNDSAAIFTVTGPDTDGIVISESLSGGNSTSVSTTAFFKTVTSIITDTTTASTITVGWNSADGSVFASVKVDWRQSPFNVSQFVSISGTLTYTVQHTEDDPGDVYANSYSEDATWRDTTGLIALTADGEGNIAFPVRSVRVIVTAGSGSGKFTTLQGQTM